MKLSPLRKSPGKQGQKGLGKHIFENNHMTITKNRKDVEIINHDACDSDLAKSKGNVDENRSENFVRDPGKTRKPLAHSDNLMRMICCKGRRRNILDN